MSAVVELREGAVYFYAAFRDSEFRYPRIDTYVYQGFDESDGHTFQDAESYLAMQSGEEPSNGHCMCFADGEIEWMFDKKNLIEWLKEDHSPQQVASTISYRVV